ncbi:hypothetical protein [Dasineura jujubifolia toursvirus 2a]|nr:hypothetical protein [Dasineura jujubifolia toursvirus 2a]
MDLIRKYILVNIVNMKTCKVFVFVVLCGYVNCITQQQKDLLFKDAFFMENNPEVTQSGKLERFSNWRGGFNTPNNILNIAAHHINSRQSLQDLWNLITSSSDNFPIFLDMLEDIVNNAIETNPRTDIQVDLNFERCHQIIKLTRQALDIEDESEIKSILDSFLTESPRYKAKNNKKKKYTDVEYLQRLFVWIPYNLYQGPRNTYDDPESEYDNRFFTAIVTSNEDLIEQGIRFSTQLISAKDFKKNLLSNIVLSTFAFMRVPLISHFQVLVRENIETYKNEPTIENLNNLKLSNYFGLKILPIPMRFEYPENWYNPNLKETLYEQIKNSIMTRLRYYDVFTKNAYITNENSKPKKMEDGNNYQKYTNILFSPLEEQTYINIMINEEKIKSDFYYIALDLYNEHTKKYEKIKKIIEDAGLEQAMNIYSKKGSYSTTNKPDHGRVQVADNNNILAYLLQKDLVDLLIPTLIMWLLFYFVYKGQSDVLAYKLSNIDIKDSNSFEDALFNLKKISRELSLEYLEENINYIERFEKDLDNYFEKNLIDNKYSTPILSCISIIGSEYIYKHSNNRAKRYSVNRLNPDGNLFDFEKFMLSQIWYKVKSKNIGVSQKMFLQNILFKNSDELLLNYTLNDICEKDFPDTNLIKCLHDIEFNRNDSNVIMNLKYLYEKIIEDYKFRNEVVITKSYIQDNISDNKIYNSINIICKGEHIKRNNIEHPVINCKEYLYRGCFYDQPLSEKINFILKKTGCYSVNVLTLGVASLIRSC